MEYFNLRTSRCTSCLRHYSFHILCGYDMIDPGNRAKYMDDAEASLPCCRSHFMSPQPTPITRQDEGKVFNINVHPEHVEPRAKVLLYPEDRPLRPMKEIMLLPSIPEEMTTPIRRGSCPPDQWEYIRSGATIPNNADFPIIDYSVVSDRILPGQAMGPSSIVLTTKEYTHRTYLIF